MDKLLLHGHFVAACTATLSRQNTATLSRKPICVELSYSLSDSRQIRFSGNVGEPAATVLRPSKGCFAQLKENGGSSAAPKPPPPYAHAARSRFLRFARPASRRLTPTLTSGSAAGRS